MYLIQSDSESPAVHFEEICDITKIMGVSL